MDLRGIANAASNTVNENVLVTLKASTGSTQPGGAGSRQVPGYAAPVTGFAQLQALSTSDLKKLDGLNLQNVNKAIYLRGILNGVIRSDSKGGDIVTIAAPAPASYIGTWLVVKVLEVYPNWTKAAMVLQISE